MRAPLARLLRMAMLACVVSGTNVQASQYGCTVLLCLSNPAGPTAVAECVPPIRQLWRDLARGRPFPTCEEANGSALAGLVTEPYDPCPKGSRALPAGELAAVSDTAPPSGQYPTLQQFFVGIGEGNPTGDPWAATAIPATDVSREKVCVVGEPIGLGLGVVITNDTSTMAEVPIYGAVRLLEPRPARIRVIVNGEVYTTVPVQRQ
jgi:hypothetical protein